MAKVASGPAVSTSRSQIQSRWQSSPGSFAVITGSVAQPGARPGRRPGLPKRLRGGRPDHLDGRSRVIDTDDQAQVMIVVEADDHRVGGIVDIPEGPFAGLVEAS